MCDCVNVCDHDCVKSDEDLALFDESAHPTHTIFCFMCLLQNAKAHDFGGEIIPEAAKVSNPSSCHFFSSWCVVR